MSNIFPMGPRSFARMSCIGFGPQGPFKHGEHIVLKKELREDTKNEGVFFGERLIVPSAIAKFFSIAAILCDGKSVMPTEHLIPAVVFSDEAIGMNIGFEPVADHYELHVVRNEVKPHSWLVRLVRRWLGFSHDPPKPLFCASILGEIVPHAEVEAKRKERIERLGPMIPGLIPIPVQEPNIQ